MEPAPTRLSTALCALLIAGAGSACSNTPPRGESAATEPEPSGPTFRTQDGGEPEAAAPGSDATITSDSTPPTEDVSGPEPAPKPAATVEVCEGRAEGSPCAVPCFGAASCVSGGCQPDPGSLVACPPAEDPCVAALGCDLKTGACTLPIFEAAGVPCDADTNICTLEACDGHGECLPTGTTETCEQASAAGPCWTWGCTPEQGCVQATFLSGIPCNDGNPCTTADVCASDGASGGACVGSPVPVDDLNPCTSDGCVLGIVTHEPLNGAVCPAPPGACSATGVCEGSSCAPTSACGCTSDRDCPQPADACAGQAFCDLSVAPHACATAPGTKLGAGNTNACGGCAALPAPPGSACGPCGLDAYQCDGLDALVCPNSGAANACGGCAPLTGSPGDPCGGGCGTGTLACAADAQSLICVGGPAPAPGTCGAEGLVAFYRLDETTGLMSDSSGCGGEGTPIGTVDDACGVFSYGAGFDGDLDRIHIDETSALDDLPALTIEAWVLQQTSDFGAYAAYGDGADGDAWFFASFIDRRLHAAFGFPPTCSGMGSFLDDSGALVPLGTWTHVAMTADLATSTLRFYIDAQETLSQALPAVLTSFCPTGPGEGLTLGNLGEGASWGFIGTLDHVMIHSVVRTPHQICQDAGGAWGPPCDLSGVKP